MRSVWKMSRCLLCVLLAVLCCLGVCGCEKASESEDAYCRIGGKTIPFLSDVELQKLKEPLTALLSNHPDDYFAESPDPSAPSIPYSYECGLFDVTGDGIPELLVFPYGYTGSSGCSTYYVYDIPTGEKLCEIDGDASHDWCMYYSLAGENCSPWILYQYSGGWSSQQIYTVQLCYDGKELTRHARFHISRASGRLAESEGEMIESYAEVVCYSDGKRVSAEDFYWDYTAFQNNYIRIPETTLFMIDWDDVCDSGDDRFTKGEKMAEALLSSGQAFLLKPHR